jgi:hypothetical protein
MIRCDICGKPATKSVEHEWRVYEILDAKEEEYGGSYNIATDDEITLRCDECYEHLDDVDWEREHQRDVDLVEWEESNMGEDE